MKKCVALASVTLALASAWAGTTYTEEGTVLVATVDAAETNEFDSTYATKLNANDYTAFEKRGNGGLGIFMTKQLMDDVLYEYKDGQNILTLKKNL